MSEVRIEDLGNQFSRELTEEEAKSIRGGIAVETTLRPPFDRWLGGIQLPRPPEGVIATTEYPYFMFIARQ